MLPLRIAVAITQEFRVVCELVQVLWLLHIFPCLGTLLFSQFRSRARSAAHLSAVAQERIMKPCKVNEVIYLLLFSAALQVSCQQLQATSKVDASQQQQRQSWAANGTCSTSRQQLQC
jgi:hypothetical protein